MENNIEMFNKIVDYSNAELGYDLLQNAIEFYIWCEIVLTSREENRKIPINDYSQLGAMIHTIENANLQVTSEMNIKLNDIIDFVIDYYNIITKKEMTSNDIIKAMLDEYIETEED